MNASTIEIKGSVYRMGKLNALAQFHVTRRLGPILATMGISLSKLEAGAKGMSWDDFLPILEPITDVMAKMSNQDVDYVIITCLSVVSRQQGEGKFSPIMTGTNLLFEDIDMPVMLRLVVAVLQENLGGFLPGLSDAQTSQSS